MFSIGVAAVALLLGAAVIRAILRRVHGMIDRLSEIADGDRDLSQRMDTSHNDELSRLAHRFNTFADRIAAVIRDTIKRTRRIDQGSEELSCVAATIASGASEQAACLQQISSSIAFVTERSQASSEDVRTAAGESCRTRQIVGEGSEQVTIMAATMQQLESSSREVVGAIGQIDAIAFQTNLLALNAAVEAARAGEAGKGFGVVAEEVRALALRSADAARRTAEIMRESDRHMREGVRVAALVHEGFEQILTQVDHVDDRLQQVTEAAIDQATTLSEMNTGLGQLGQVATQSSASAEQLAASARESSADVTHLLEVVGGFRVQGD